MDKDPELPYKANSTVGVLDENELRGFEAWLHRCGETSVHFPDSYIRHLKRSHGGIPERRCFQTPGGTSHVVERFLNFLGKDVKNDLTQYSVPCTWSAIEDRLGPSLMPIVELFAGDKLCLDFRQAPEPEIVIWYHELSSRDQPATEFVAQDFNAFLVMLQDESA